MADTFKTAWGAFAKAGQACSQSKPWWNASCANVKAKAMALDDPDNWHTLKHATKSAKQTFFDNKINEIVCTNKRPWDLMNWVGPQKVPLVEAISFQGQPCNTPDKLWNALYSTFNSAHDCPYNLNKLKDQWSDPTQCDWVPFSHQNDGMPLGVL
jgi:hypothetical protein